MAHHHVPQEAAALLGHLLDLADVVHDGDELVVSVGAPTADDLVHPAAGVGSAHPEGALDPECSEPETVAFIISAATGRSMPSLAGGADPYWQDDQEDYWSTDEPDEPEPDHEPARRVTGNRWRRRARGPP